MLQHFTNASRKDRRLFIGGPWYRQGRSEAREIINLATGQMIGLLQPTSAWDRAALLKRAVQLIRERKPSLAAMLTLDNGKALAAN